jgi:epoxyqueuosine reductase
VSAVPAGRQIETELKNAIKQKAAELGFALCGITTAHPPPHHKDYVAWLDLGYAGELEYLHRQEQKRSDLRQVMPGVKSLVVVALNYYSGDELAAEQTSGIVARYARFDDYHETMWRRLDDLLTYIKTIEPGTSGKAYCDTGPITERDLAMRAGLGWIGKHTNLISRRLGNWFFIGELLLDCEIEPDEPESPHCGSCQRCLPACPTGAITGPFQLDARRCISYLTIELKGSIPIELRSSIGNRIYGCDDCLAVCPWNKFAVKSDDPEVRPRKDLVAADLCELLTLNDRAFLDRFEFSPIKRTKRRGLLRNVCVALGNVGDRSAFPYLDKACDDYEPLIREHAAWAIKEINRRTEIE